MGNISFKFHQINSSSKIFNKSFFEKDSEVVFLPGCSLSGYNDKLVMNIFDYLKKHIKNISISFSCCYKPSIMIKDYKSFDKYYKNFNENLENNKMKTVITACPNCYKTIKANSPNVKVELLLDVIDKIGIDKKILNHYKDLGIVFSIHDACSIRGNESIYNSSRNILNQLGVDFLEFEKNKQNTVCCGAIHTDNDLRKKQTEKRVSTAPTDYILCYCETCSKSMISGGKKSLHILDLIFNEDVLSKKIFTQENKPTISAWNNRYKLIKSGREVWKKNQKKY